ncbi:MAG: RAMP superfamily CRISPR-associated protein [Helicobacteraceae bacterium]|jgi:CRISPR-associated protein Csm5|nr:RAMP superfamily CRISPR-associated protein [Helicobacteraceae bacterium]
MKTHHLKLTALSPIHIGTGKDYELTNYVMLAEKDRSGNAIKKLFEFDEISFYKELNENDKKEFMKFASDSSPYAIFKLYRFIHDRAQIARGISFNSVRVADKVYNKYKEGIGQVVQKESGNKSVFNKFAIGRTYRTPNNHQAVLPGSSIKGSISTAYQEALYKERRDYNDVKKRMLELDNSNLFKNFLISDALPIKYGDVVNYAVNKKRNKETRREPMETILEFIAPDSEFKTTVVCKEQLDFGAISKSCNDHYMPIFQSQFDTESDEFTKQALSDSFIKDYENWKPKQNQFLIRVGKHSGARAVTVDGVREIKIRTGSGREKTEDQETTIWLTYNRPFGWLLCEVIE